MKVLVISDTHRRLQNAESLLNRLINQGGLDAVVHCGDHIDDARSLEKKFPNLAFYMVPGNCDFEGMGSGTSLFTEIGGVPTLITHGHKHHVKYGTEELVIDAQAYEAKLVLFGHSHIAYKVKKEGILLLNPGSLSEPRDTMYPSFALLDLEMGEVKNARILQMRTASVFSSHPCY